MQYIVCVTRPRPAIQSGNTGQKAVIPVSFLYVKRSIRDDAEGTFECELEHVLPISLRQPDYRIGKNHFIRCAGYRGDASIDDAHRKILGDAVDLLPKSRLEPLAGDPDPDEWPLLGRQIGREA